ncbi:hypothetical protein VP01_576g5 [Puccinia sorghi]|uniref:Uncharacterized protein n=1 Tax=Puccinia sorghi TaxID=27349 RepID=A0A0L6UID0_9BASI|nr:hypothetical protein VP01_576g5 [Puccinia sorghi]
MFKRYLSIFLAVEALSAVQCRPNPAHGPPRQLSRRNPALIRTKSLITDPTSNLVVRSSEMAAEIPDRMIQYPSSVHKGALHTSNSQNGYIDQAGNQLRFQELYRGLTGNAPRIREKRDLGNSRCLEDAEKMTRIKGKNKVSQDSEFQASSYPGETSGTKTEESKLTGIGSRSANFVGERAEWIQTAASTHWQKATTKIKAARSFQEPIWVKAKKAVESYEKAGLATAVEGLDRVTHLLQNVLKFIEELGVIEFQDQCEMSALLCIAKLASEGADLKWN